MQKTVLSNPKHYEVIKMLNLLITNNYERKFSQEYILRNFSDKEALLIKLNQLTKQKKFDYLASKEFNIQVNFHEKESEKEINSQIISSFLRFSIWINKKIQKIFEIEEKLIENEKLNYKSNSCSKTIVYNENLIKELEFYKKDIEQEKNELKNQKNSETEKSENIIEKIFKKFLKKTRKIKFIYKKLLEISQNLFLYCFLICIRIIYLGILGENLKKEEILFYIKKNLPEKIKIDENFYEFILENLFDFDIYKFKFSLLINRITIYESILVLRVLNPNIICFYDKVNFYNDYLMNLLNEDPKFVNKNKRKIEFRENVSSNNNKVSRKITFINNKAEDFQLKLIIISLLKFILLNLLFLIKLIF